MKTSFLILLFFFLTLYNGFGKHSSIEKDEIINIFLNTAEDSNNIYTVAYYDSLLDVNDMPETVFFIHLAKSLRLSISDVPRATKELIGAKTWFSKEEDLKKYKHYLGLTEASLYQHLGKYDKADLLTNRSIEKFEESKNETMALISRMYKVRNYIPWGRYEEGFDEINYLFDSLDPNAFTSKSQFEKFEMALWNHKATLWTSVSNLHRDSIKPAQEVLQHVINLAKEKGDEHAYYNTTGNLSYLFYLNQEYKKMIPLALEDLSYSIAKNSVESAGGLHTVLADSYLQLGMKDSASYHIKKAEHYSKYLKNKYIHKIFIGVAQRYYESTGNLDAAFESLNEQYEAINEIHKSIAQINFDLSKAENDLSQAEERIQLLDYKNRQNITINWLLGSLLFSIGLLAFNFYRLHRTQKKFRDKLEQMNQSLESEIERRTKEVVEQSEKIKAAAYHNSHRTRAPVARLLGLVDILNTEISSEREEIAEYIRQSAREIDEVIIDMNEVLSDHRGK
ncbi:hypothetical protein [Reichenbachiella sp.]|uniref:hypothetical protein n=1 Tax=Reichenbachiella sp. TaxID=2184521 RepID=UPI003BB007F2